MYSRDDNDGRGKYRLYPLQKTSSPGPETTYDYIDNHGKVWKCPEKGWRMIQSKLKKLENEGRLCLENSTLSEKAYWNERESTGKLADTLWDDLSENNVGTNEVASLFNGKFIFDNPKPVDLLNRCIQICGNNFIALDFFSGSGTLGHAIIYANSTDGGDRKFIMVQLPEPTDENSEAFKAGYKNICEIGKEHIRRAGEKIKAELREKQKEQLSILEEDTPVNPDDLDIGFKVLKLDTSNLKKWNPDYENIEESLLDSIENYVDGRSELDVVYEIMLKYGIDLTLPLEEYEVGGKKIYSIGYGALMICLDREITTDVANEIVRLKENLKPEVMRVVFKDNGFKDDSAKTNTKEILRNAGIEEIVSV
jgi:adenine-specific DNA-methyltransferase